MDINKLTGAEETSIAPEWHQIIKPEIVAVILGNKGKGKSALAYWIGEDAAKSYGLLPVVINLPRERQHLLPPNWVLRQLSDMPHISDAVIIIDEGTTMLPAGASLENMVKGFVSLSRQRNQIIIFIFHSSSDVGSRILRGVDVLLLKEPSKRQIQHGSKDKWWQELLTEAKGRFKALKDMKADPRQYTWVDCEEPEFQGMLPNPLASFWSTDLSKAWAGLDTMAAGKEPQVDLFTQKSDIRPVEFKIVPKFEKGVITAFTVEDPLREFIRSRSTLLAKLAEHFPTVNLGEASIEYDQYFALVNLRKADVSQT